MPRSSKPSPSASPKVARDVPKASFAEDPLTREYAALRSLSERLAPPSTM